jgi:hypothetical protein
MDRFLARPKQYPLTDAERADLLHSMPRRAVVMVVRSALA